MLRKNRILWITNNWLFDYGGRKNASKKILNFLAGKACEIKLLDFEIREKKRENTASQRELSQKIGFTAVYLPDNKKITLKLIEFSRKNKFDQIIVSGSAPINLLTIFSIRFFNLYPKAKIIFFEHTNPLLDIKLATYGFIYRALASIYYRKADYIITPSHLLKKLFINRFSVDKNIIKTIHYPIVDKKIFKLSQEKIKNNIFPVKKSEIIITSARLDLKQKDYLTLLRAFKAVQEVKPETALVILGQGPDESVIKKMAEKLKIKKKTFFLGFQKNPYKFIAKSDVFVLSSKFEGFGIALVEAMACKIPVIATDCQFGPREIIEENKNGRLIPVGDEKALAEEILFLLKNQQVRIKVVKNGLIKIGKYSSYNSLRNWYNFLLNEQPKLPKILSSVA